MTTMGKYRHLSHASTRDGHFVIMAIDHRANLLESLNQYAPQPLTDAGFTDFKQQVISSLTPYASALLTDPAYGIGPGVASRVISGQIGLLAPIEVTDYGLHPSERRIEYIPNWSVEKIKRVGGDGVKLLLPYHPEADHVNEMHAIVRQIVDDCAKYDIPFYLEPIPYALDPRATLSNAELLQISVEMCKTFSDMDVDILKLPFPVDTKQNSDESEWHAACEAVNDACTVPWALLSAGVNYETFAKQVEIACEAGACGVIVGRAVWAEAVKLQGEARTNFLNTTAVERMKELSAICATHAETWMTCTDPPDASIGWYEA